MKHRAFQTFFLLWIAMIVACYFVSYSQLPFAWYWDLAIALNVSSFLLFGVDKHAAIQKSMRIPENLLYLATLVGGSAGTLVGMNVFRHKTRKTSFQFVVALVLLVQLLIWLLLFQPEMLGVI